MSEKKIYTTKSTEETFRLAQDLARGIGQIPLAVGLVGDLGAGKTVFVKGFASAFGVDPDQVNSPTFTLVNEYPTLKGFSIYHFDLYRIGPSDLYTLGWEETVGRKGISLIEWVDRAGEYLPEVSLWINIRHLGGDEREIEISFPGSSIG